MICLGLIATRLLYHFARGSAADHKEAKENRRPLTQQAIASLQHPPVQVVAEPQPRQQASFYNRRPPCGRTIPPGAEPQPRQQASLLQSASSMRREDTAGGAGTLAVVARAAAALVRLRGGGLLSTPRPISRTGGYGAARRNGRRAGSGAKRPRTAARASGRSVLSRALRVDFRRFVPRSRRDIHPEPGAPAGGSFCLSPAHDIRRGAQGGSRARSLHGNQELLRLLRRILCASPAPGDVVMGAVRRALLGRVAVWELGRRCFGAEIAPRYHVLAAKPPRPVRGARPGRAELRGLRRRRRPGGYSLSSSPTSRRTQPSR
jgi:hypothetical protein